MMAGMVELCKSNIGQEIAKEMYVCEEAEYPCLVNIPYMTQLFEEKSQSL